MKCKFGLDGLLLQAMYACIKKIELHEPKKIVGIYDAVQIYEQTAQIYGHMNFKSAIA